MSAETATLLAASIAAVAALMTLLVNTVAASRQEGRSTRAENWRLRANAAADELEQIRRRVRYPLAGLDEGLRVLTRLPSWVAQG